MADASIFISCAMSLAVFDVSKHIENGIVIEPRHENTTGTIRHVNKIIGYNYMYLLMFITSHPEPFKCCIKPRSEKAVSLILTESL